jgi:hypothetical protein
MKSLQHQRKRRLRDPAPASVEVAQIVCRNLFTLFNAIILPPAIVLFILNDYRGAIAVSGMAFANTAIGLYQKFAMYWPPSSDFFQLKPLSSWQWMLALAVSIPVSGLALLTDRLLGVAPSTPQARQQPC